MADLRSGKANAHISKDSSEHEDRASPQTRLRTAGALLILAGAVSMLMLVAGFSSMDAQDGEVMYFEVWLPPWFLLGEIMLFTSMATVSIVTGVSVRGGNNHRFATVGAICSLVGFGFALGLPGLVLMSRARRGVSALSGESH